VILADTSVWIDLLAGCLKIRDNDLLKLVVCGPVAQEVLQGLRPGTASDAFRDRFLALPVVSDPIPIQLFLSAAEIFSRGRRKGLTIRSSVDCLIAAIAIENSIPVWHRDRDFDVIASYTALEARSVRTM
jgi:predicted nucleic acid-binding protein